MQEHAPKPEFMDEGPFAQIGEELEGSGREWSRQGLGFGV